MTALHFVTPPDTRLNGVSRRMDDAIAVLKKHPGQWAVLRVCSTKGQANSYRARYKRYYPDCEIVSRTEGEQVKIYARYINT